MTFVRDAAIDARIALGGLSYDEKTSGYTTGKHVRLTRERI